jgi:hypothetical protein
MGSVVVPATDGTLRGLGFDVPSLGKQALGLVLETRGSKSLIQFPDLKTTLWLAHDELADVQVQSERPEYKALMPQWLDQELRSDLQIVWVVWILNQILPVKAVLHLEQGTLQELWGSSLGSIEDYLRPGLHAEQWVWHLSLGVQELDLDQWNWVQKLLGARLLMSRFLPAGLSKIEVLMFLGAQAPAADASRGS